MPSYTYRCPACGFEMTVQHRMDQNPSYYHEVHAKMQRVPQACAVIYKGSGFYSTDHSKGGASS